ncbi:MAG: FecR family protein [Mangrovibacterium sp.]
MDTSENIGPLIEKYLNDQCSDGELKRVTRFFMSDKYREKLQPLLLDYWNNTPSFRNGIDATELGQMLDSIHHRINTGQNQPKRKWFRFYELAIRVAAALFIPLLLFSIWAVSNRNNYGSNNFITLETPLGSKLKTTLPDGTEVWQNAGSTLKYPAQFNSKKREVTLIGEAYFHVTSDRKHPFHVKTNEGTVSVTGTRFNVSSYPDDANYSVVLEEGVVSFQAKNSTNSIRLQPSEQVLLNKQNGALQKATIDTDKFTSWTQGKLIFRNDPLSEVITRLNRWYNADVVLNDPDGNLGQHPFTMTVQNETVEQVLEYITEAAGLQLKTKEIHQSLNGSIIRTKYEIVKTISD